MMLNRQLDFIPLWNKRFIWLNVLVWILLIWYWRTSGFAIWNGLLSVRYYRNKKEIKVEFNSLVRQIKYPEVTTYPIDEEVDTATFYHLFMYFELDQCCYFTCYFVLSACTPLQNHDYSYETCLYNLPLGIFLVNHRNVCCSHFDTQMTVTCVE